MPIMTNCIRVRKAQPTGSHSVPDVQIEISGHIPESRGEEGMSQIRRAFQADAEKLFDGLRSLPGGTFDQLLILMLQKQASSFIVPHDFKDSHLQLAAPDLLVACEAFVDFAPSEGHRCLYCNISVYGTNDTNEHLPDCEMEKAHAAIAKARGESEAKDG